VLSFDEAKPRYLSTIDLSNPTFERNEGHFSSDHRLDL
jgi:hypothetical protein